MVQPQGSQRRILIVCAAAAGVRTCLWSLLSWLVPQASAPQEFCSWSVGSCERRLAILSHQICSGSNEGYSPGLYTSAEAPHASQQPTRHLD